MKVRIEIPKDFYENKHSVAIGEFAEMFSTIAKQVEELEEDSIANFEWSIKQMEENRELKENNKLLRDALLKKDIEIMRLKEQLGKELGA